MRNSTIFLKNSIIICTLLFTGLNFISCIRGDVPDFDNAEVETVISDFPANDALSTDRRGNVYASNFGAFVGSGGTGKSLFKVNPFKKELVEVANDLTGPLGNVVDNKGNIYVNNGNDFVNADILKIAKDGTQSIIATIDGFPSGMAIDQSNNLYISNFVSPTIHKVTSEGEVSVFANDARLAGCVGVDFDNNGNLIAGNYLNGEIFSVNMDGEVEFIGAIPKVVDNFVLGYLTFFKGFIYATAIGENLIYKISLAGDVSVFAGNGEPASIDGPLLDASFNVPNGITVDSNRKTLYISEFGPAGGLRAIKLY